MENITLWHLLLVALCTKVGAGCLGFLAVAIFPTEDDHAEPLNNEEEDTYNSFDHYDNLK